MVTYPEDWKEFRFKDTGIEVSKGQVITRADVRIGEIPVVAGGMEPAYYCDKYNRDGFTVTISASGANAGYVNLYKGKIFASDCSTISEAPNYDVRYIYYLLLNKQNEIYDAQTGGAQPHIHPKDIYKLPIVYTSNISEQQAIASVISDFDEHIDNLTELIEKKKAIRDGALEDLVSGRTRLDGFNGEWKTVSFNQVIKPKARIGWQGLKKDEYLRSGYSYLIGGTDFHNGTVNLDNISYISKERYDMDSNIQVESNNVLVTKDGTIGKVALVPKLDRPATLNSGVFVFRTTSSLLSNFLYRVLLSSIFREFINTLSAGSTIKHLYQKDLSNFEFKIPQDSQEQEAIALILTAMDEEIEFLETEKEKMIQIKEGAMDDLLTGRVRLKV